MYTTEFECKNPGWGGLATLWFESINNIATIKVNDRIAGILWTEPYTIDITRLVKPGKNKLEIMVSNTWANRLIGDQRLPKEKRVTWTTAPFRLSGKPLLSSGLIGRVDLITH